MLKRFTNFDFYMTDLFGHQTAELSHKPFFLLKVTRGSILYVKTVHKF